MQGRKGNGQSQCSVYYAVDFEARCVCVRFSKSSLSCQAKGGEDKNVLECGDSVLLWKHVIHIM